LADLPPMAARTATMLRHNAEYGRRTMSGRRHWSAKLRPMGVVESDGAEVLPYAIAIAPHDHYHSQSGLFKAQIAACDRNGAWQLQGVNERI
jgi:hypothetical protein